MRNLALLLCLETAQSPSPQGRGSTPCRDDLAPCQTALSQRHPLHSALGSRAWLNEPDRSSSPHHRVSSESHERTHPRHCSECLHTHKNKHTHRQCWKHHVVATTQSQPTAMRELSALCPALGSCVCANSHDTDWVPPGGPALSYSTAQESIYLPQIRTEAAATPFSLRC